MEDKNYSNKDIGRAYFINFTGPGEAVKNLAIRIKLINCEESINEVYKKEGSTRNLNLGLDEETIRNLDSLLKKGFKKTEEIFQREQDG